MVEDYRHILFTCFQAGVEACLPENCLPPFLELGASDKPKCVLGAGKAAAQMASVVNTLYPGRCYGTVVTRYGHGQDTCTGGIKLLEAGHPVPDANSLKAAELILTQAASVPLTGAHSIVLLSGGGSALMCLPQQGISFEEKTAVHQFLLRSGASISEINCVRTHLSAIKGGKLGSALGDSLHSTYIISDVVGDDLTVIASGPTIQPKTKPLDAWNILKKYSFPMVPSIYNFLQINELSSPVKQSEIHIVASAHTMLEAATKLAESFLWNFQIISPVEVGEAADVGRRHAEIALEAKQMGKRIILFSGGELTVTHSGQGRGGPNQEYLLALAEALEGTEGIYALACDTDGIDGSEDNAGAYISPNTLAAAKKLNLSPVNYLDMHNSYSFFKSLGDLVVTGPTGTNVNDFRAILVDP